MKEAYLRVLDALITKHCASALTSPTRCDLFEYGLAVGIKKGIEEAREGFLGLLADEAARERGR